MNFDQANQIRILGDEMMDLRRRLGALHRRLTISLLIATLSLAALIYSLILGHGSISRVVDQIQHPQSIVIQDADTGEKMSINAHEIACTHGQQPGFVIKNTRSGPSINLYDTEGNLRLTNGVAYTINKKTNDQSISSPGHITIYTPKGNVEWESHERGLADP